MNDNLPQIVASLMISTNDNDRAFGEVIAAALGAWADGHAEFFLQTACASLRGHNSWIMARPSLN